METTYYLIVLDFCTGRCSYYTEPTFKMGTSSEVYEKYLDEAEHDVENCQWMVSTTPPVYTELLF